MYKAKPTVELLSVQFFLFLFTGFYLYPSLPMPRQAATPSSSQFVSYVCRTVRTWNKDKAHTTGRKQTRPTLDNNFNFKAK